MFISCSDSWYFAYKTSAQTMSPFQEKNNHWIQVYQVSGFDYLLASQIYQLAATFATKQHMPGIKNWLQHLNCHYMETIT